MRASVRASSLATWSASSSRRSPCSSCCSSSRRRSTRRGCSTTGRSRFQVGRESPFSIWDWRQYHARGIPDLHLVQRVLQVGSRRDGARVRPLAAQRSPLRMAALTTVLLIGFEVVLTHWSYLYLPWFFPFVVSRARRAAAGGEGRGRKRRSSLTSRTGAGRSVSSRSRPAGSSSSASCSSTTGSGRTTSWSTGRSTETYGDAIVHHGLVPVPRLRGRLPAGRAARVRAAVALRRLPRPASRSLIAACGVGLVAVVAWLRVRRRRSTWPSRRCSSGSLDPLALRPLAGAARHRRARRAARRPAPARLGGCSALAVAAKLWPFVLVPLAFALGGGARPRCARRTRRRARPSPLAVVPVRGPRAARALRQRPRAGRPAAADREPRRVAAHHVRAPARSRRRTARRTSSATARSPRRSSAVAGVAIVALWLAFLRGPDRPRTSAPVLGGLRLRLRRVRQGALAAVPALARPTRAARARPARVSRRPACSPRRSCSRRSGSPRATGATSRGSTWPVSCLRATSLLVALFVVLAWPAGRPSVPAYPTSTLTASQLRRAAVGAALDERPLDAHAARRGLEAHGQARDEPLDRTLGLAADHRVVRAGHAGVGDRSGAADEHARVVRLHVRMRAEHGGDASVEVARERDLLARRLGVEVDDDHRSRRARASATRRSAARNGLSNGSSENTPSRLITATPSCTARPTPGCPRRHVRRPEHAVGARRGTARSRAGPTSSCRA